MICRLLLILIVSFVTCPYWLWAEETDKGVNLTSEIALVTEGSKVRISLILVNNGEKQAQLLTGRLGETNSGRFQPYNLDASTIPGSGKLVVPILNFSSRSFSPPQPANQPTYRSMRPTLFSIPPGQSRRYCFFTVPSEWLSGEFKDGRIVFPALESGEKEIIIKIEKAKWEKPE